MLFEESEGQLISNLEGLLCDTCKFKTSKIATCTKYPSNKPSSALDTKDSAECPEYKQAEI